MSSRKEPHSSPKKSPSLTRTEQQEALLQEALARPGIAEALRLYGNWKEMDRSQEPYRETMRRRPVTFATNHVNLIPGRNNARME